MPPWPPFLTRALVRSSLPIASLSRHVHRSRVTFTHLDGTPGPLHQAPRHVLSSLWHVQGVLGCSGRRATGDRWATTGAEEGKEKTVQVVMSTRTISSGGVGSAAAEESSNKERGEAGDGAEAGSRKTGVEAVSTTASPSAGGKGESPRKEVEGKSETLSFSLPTEDGKEGSSAEAGKSQAVSSPAELFTESPSAEGFGDDGAAEKQTKITGRGPKPKKREGEHWSRIYECPTCGLRLARWKRMQHHLKTQKVLCEIFISWHALTKTCSISGACPILRGSLSARI